MYEAHFGLSGPPFQLNPDPAFYFDSRGHSNALAYLRYGVYQGEGFIVVTGEIGAGKTTLVRTLLEGLDPEKVVAAQVVSTQLESGDLLRAISNAFGIPLSGQTKAHVLASLEGFLNALVVTGRRALLVVDEAQNLDPEAIEELRMLSNFHVGNRALLQSFLVGQPELRTLMESASMEQLRQRVIASCHLGPLGFEETRSYVEHRLRHVGWDDRPHFEPRAFAAIHTATDGIPRRINLLCNRLLLAAFLANKPDIDADTVERVAAELRGETGVSKFVPPTDGTAGDESQPAHKSYRITDEGVTRQMHAHSASTAAPLMIFADSAGGLLKAAALARAAAADPRLPPTVIVNPYGQAMLDARSDSKLLSDSPAVVVHLGVAGGAAADRSAAVTLRVAALFDEFKPAALMCVGHADPVVDAALLARRRGLRVARMHAGIRLPSFGSPDGLNAALLDRMADVHYTSGLAAQSALQREGIAPEHVVCVGNATYMLLDSIGSALPETRTLLDTSVRGRAAAASPGAAHYLLVTADLDDVDVRVEDAHRLAAALRELGRSTHLVWTLSEGSRSVLQSQHLADELVNAGVALLPRASFLQDVALAKASQGLVAGRTARLADEASCFGVRTAVVGGGAVGPVRGADSRVTGIEIADPSAATAVLACLNTDERSSVAQPYWDHDVGNRIAMHLGTWIAGPSVGSPDSAARRAQT